MKLIQRRKLQHFIVIALIVAVTLLIYVLIRPELAWKQSDHVKMGVLAIGSVMSIAFVLMNLVDDIVDNRYGLGEFQGED